MTAIINADNDACKVSFLLLAWTLLVFLNRQLFNLQPASHQPSFENYYYLQLANTSNS
jgi:hypothetical protein